MFKSFHLTQSWVDLWWMVAEHDTWFEFITNMALGDHTHVYCHEDTRGLMFMHPIYTTVCIRHYNTYRARLKSVKHSLTLTSYKSHLEVVIDAYSYHLACLSDYLVKSHLEVVIDAYSYHLACLSDYLVKSHLEVVIDAYSYHLACLSDYLVRPWIGIYKELISWSYSYHLDCQFAQVWNYT